MNRSGSARPAQAHRLLFPAAAIFAATAVPFWALRYTGLMTRVPGNWPAHWHGHEMVFGYALAVVGGYLLTRLSSLGLTLTFGAWLLGRLVYLGPELPPWATATAALAYPICLFAIAGTAFLRAAKRGRNAAFGLLLAGFVLAELLVQLTPLGLMQDGAGRGLILGIDLIAMLLFAMGGRIIAAATSGALQRQGQHLPNLAQPGLEKLGMLALLSMTLLDGLVPLPRLAAALAMVAAGTIVTRLAGWRVWRIVGVADVAVLHLGYGWLAFGLVLKAVAQTSGALALPDALHGITIGGLGTLSIAMMTRVSLQRSRRPVAMPPLVLSAVGLISVAAAFRLAAGWPALRLLTIDAAAACWTLAFLAVARFLLRSPR